MTERIGVCGGCGAKFKVPPTFQAARAKCPKCGSVVEIGAAGDSPTPAAETAAPATGRASQAGGRRAGAGRASKAGAAAAGAGRRAGGAKGKGRGTRAGARRGAEEEEEEGGRGGRRGRGGREAKKDNTMLYAGIGVAVLLVGGLGFFLMKQKSASDAAKVAAAAEESARESEKDMALDAAPSITDAIDPIAESAGDSMDSMDDAATPTPVKTPAPVVEEPTLDASSPVISFDPYSKPPTVSDEEWGELASAIRIGFLESSPPRKRTPAKKIVYGFGPAAVPALINAFNGLDLSEPSTFISAGDLVKTVQSVSGTLIQIPFILDQSDMEKNQQHNIKQVNGLIKYWAKYSTDESYPDFVEKVEKKKANLAEEVPLDEW